LDKKKEPGTFPGFFVFFLAWQTLLNINRQFATGVDPGNETNSAGLMEVLPKFEQTSMFAHNPLLPYIFLLKVFFFVFFLAVKTLSNINKQI
jgi:hypothetical protein